MLISELINELNKAKETNGDKEIVFLDGYGDGYGLYLIAYNPIRDVIDIFIV